MEITHSVRLRPQKQGRDLSKLTTREAGKALLKLLVTVLAVDMNLGLFIYLDHPDLLLAHSAACHHRGILGLRWKSAFFITNASLDICLLLLSPPLDHPDLL